MRILVTKNSDIIAFQKQRLIESRDDTPDTSVRILFIFSHSIKREEYAYYMNLPILERKITNFIGLIDRRLKGEPLSQITGNRYFWKDEFYVNRNVLDPRPESELIVEIGKNFLFDGVKVLDVGAGSGCIGLSLKRENPNINITLSDISKSAILVMKKNAKTLKMNCEFINSNLFKNIKDRFDLIVCNLPYIKTSHLMSLPQDVILFEPHQALIGGDDGLGLIFDFLDNVSFYLTMKGVFIIEIGIQQIDLIIKKLNDLNYQNYKVFNDTNGISRTVCVQKDTVNSII